MAPLSQGGGACHTRGFVYFQYGNALSIVFILVMSSHEMWIFSSKFEVVVGGGGCLAPDPPTTPKLQLDFLDLEIFLVKVGGGGGGGVSGARPPHHYP